MARAMCTDCGERRQDPGYTGIGPELCGPCYDYAGAENEHTDNDHESVLAGTIVYGMTNHTTRKAFNTWLRGLRTGTDVCPVCHPELDPRNALVRTDTVAKSYRSHSACKHPRTPAGRAACRKTGGPGAARMTMSEPVKLIRKPIRVPADIPETDDVPRRRTRKARCICIDGALGRAHANDCPMAFASCVQAQLHTPNTIRCACGFPGGPHPDTR